MKCQNLDFLRLEISTNPKIEKIANTLRAQGGAKLDVQLIKGLDNEPPSKKSSKPKKTKKG